MGVHWFPPSLPTIIPDAQPRANIPATAPSRRVAQHGSPHRGTNPHPKSHRAAGNPPQHRWRRWEPCLSTLLAYYCLSRYYLRQNRQPGCGARYPQWTGMGSMADCSHKTLTKTFWFPPAPPTPGHGYLRHGEIRVPTVPLVSHCTELIRERGQREGNEGSRERIKGQFEGVSKVIMISGILYLIYESSVCKIYYYSIYIEISIIWLGEDGCEVCVYTE